MVKNEWISAYILNVASIYGRIGFRGYTKQDIVEARLGAMSLSPSNIRDNRIYYSPATYISWEKYDESPEIKLEDGDVVLVKTGSTFGKTAYVENLTWPTTLNPQMIVFKDIRMNKRLFAYFMAFSRMQKQINASIVGGAIPTLSQEQIYHFSIEYPINRTEQNAIAKVLSDIDNLIVSIQKLINKKKSIKCSAMQELLTGKRRLAGFNGIWSKKYFGEIFEFMPTNALTREHMGTAGTVKNIHYGDILTKYGAWLDADDRTIPTITDENLIDKYSSANYVRSGDIIIADTAEDNTVGKAVEIINVNTRMLSGQHTILCRPQEKFAERFLGYYINSVDFHNQMIPYITGIKVSSISKASLVLLEMEIPSVEEQETIAQILSDMDEEIEQLEKKLAKYQQIKQGMMQELLTGHIRLLESTEQSQTKTQIIKEKSSQKHNQYFDDAVMIAGIVNAFYSDKYPLGRKKLQKLLYLLRRKEQADISSFHKKAAGPYADTVRYKGGEPIAKKTKYIQEAKNKMGSCFSKGENIQQALTYLKEWDKQQDIEWLISEFQYTKVDELELLATVDMAMCDLSQEGKPITVQTIKDLIQSTKEWRDKLKKTYFSDSDIQRAIIKCKEIFKGVF